MSRRRPIIVCLCGSTRINKEDYIGESTKHEIEYAKSIGKKIIYYYPHNVAT